MFDKEKEDSIEVTVGQGHPEDSGLGIVRMDKRVLDRLDVSFGDLIDITGKRTTTAIVKRVFPSDVGTQVIRMSKLLRKNADTDVDELVTIRKAEPVEAKEIKIAPTADGIQIEIVNGSIGALLLGRAVRKGDLIKPSSTTEKSSSSLFDQIEESFGTPFFGGIVDLTFIVEDTDPEGTVVITEDTTIELLQVREGFEFSDSEIVYVTKKPTLTKKTEVSSLYDLKKVVNKGYILQCYEDTKTKLYFTDDFYLKMKKE